MTGREQKKFWPATPEDAKARLEELRPYLEEAEVLRRLIRAWADVEAEEEAERLGSPSGPRSRPPRRNFPTGVRKAQIVALLGDEPGLRRADVARELGLQRARAGQLVNALISEDVLRELRGGRLDLTSKGRNVHAGRHPEAPRVDRSYEFVATGDA